MTTTTAPMNEMQTFTITEEILVRASLEKTFASIITQLGRQNETGDGKPLPMMLETHPGGRWYRDLGGDNGHLWGFVQSIKRPVLLEILGAAVHVDRSDVEHAVPADGDRRRVADHVQAHGGRPVPGGVSRASGDGWKAMHERVRRTAESGGGE